MRIIYKMKLICSAQDGLQVSFRISIKKAQGHIIITEIRREMQIVTKSNTPSDAGDPTFMQLWTDAWWTAKACYTEFPSVERFSFPPIPWCPLFSAKSKTVFLVLTNRTVVSFCPSEHFQLHVFRN